MIKSQILQLQVFWSSIRSYVHQSFVLPERWFSTVLNVDRMWKWFLLPRLATVEDRLLACTGMVPKGSKISLKMLAMNDGNESILAVSIRRRHGRGQSFLQ